MTERHVIEQAMQDRQADFLLQLLDGVARFDHDHVAVPVVVIGFAGQDLRPAQGNQVADIWIGDLACGRGSRRTIIALFHAVTGDTIGTSLHCELWPGLRW